MRWQIVVFDGFDELDSIAPYEVLRAAAFLQRRMEHSLRGISGRDGSPSRPRTFRRNVPTKVADKIPTSWIVELAALGGPGEIVANHGLRLRAQAKLGPLRGARRPDVVIVPGGGWVDRNPKGARAEIERGGLPRAIAELHRNGALVASVCTGAMILAAAGLLRNRPAITHHSAIADLRAASAKIKRARVVDNGDIVTAGGVTSGLDLALHLVARFGGKALARAVARALEYQPRSAVRRR